MALTNNDIFKKLRVAHKLTNEENKKKRLGGDLMPKRIKYKKLVR